jgi:hypothetical protein
MKQNSAKDPSTLASLHPTQAREQHYRSYHNSMRMHGSHYMALRRPSRVPESGREYTPGDPVNLIDWKAYARTDQLIVREVRDEASSRIVIGIDLSETMQWPLADLTRTQVPSKAEIATRVGLNLAHLHLRMGDLVELWLFDDGSQEKPKYRAKPRSPSDIVSIFERVRSQGFSVADMKTDFNEHIYQSKKSNIAIFIGDGLGAADYCHFLAPGVRSVMFHLLSSMEIDLNWIEDDTSYFDEGLNKREYQGSVLKHGQGYQTQLRKWMGKVEGKLRKQGSTWMQITDRTGIAAYLDLLTQCQVAG